MKSDGELRYDPPAIIAVNGDGRVLFRYNTVTGSFAVFRSHRMTPSEKEFITFFYETNIAGADVPDMTAKLNYETEGDVLCS